MIVVEPVPPKEHFENRTVQVQLTALRELMDERFAALKEALDLQAAEYARRLTALNHAHEKAIEVQHTYVTKDKYEEYVKSQDVALHLALERMNEKFEDYIKRYEVRQREIDLALAVSKGAAEQSQRIAEEQGRRANRNIAIATLLLAVLVAASNYLSSL